MNGRLSSITFLALALVATVALLIAGTRRPGVRTFALGAPNEIQVAALAPGHRVCEGPIISPAPAGAVRIWGASGGGPAALSVLVKDAASETTIATGRVSLGATADPYTAALTRATPSRRPLSICLIDAGPRRVSIIGSPAIAPVPMTIDGRRTQLEFSLVLLGAARQSFLSALPTAFARAALFRPSWLGPWTFWLLSVALLGTVGLGAVAIGAAATADAREPSDPGARTAGVGSK